MIRTVDIISRVLWVLVLVGATVGADGFWAAYQEHVFLRQTPDLSAPQMAALAAEAMVWAVVPYVFARAFDGATRPRRRPIP